MADRMRVTSVILGSLPRGVRFVSLGGGRRLARFGGVDLASEAEFASELRSDTPRRILERDGRRWPQLQGGESGPSGLAILGLSLLDSRLAVQVARPRVGCTPGLHGG